MIPGDQSIVETTIGYEQVAVDITAWLCQNEPDPLCKAGVRFRPAGGLRSSLPVCESSGNAPGNKTEKLVGEYTE